jgi:transposase
LNQQLTQLCAQDFCCEADALLAADRFAKKLKYHYLATVRVTKHSQHKKPGRPRKDAQPQVNYHLQATLALHQEAVQNALTSSGRFVLATNVTDSELLTSEQVLLEYKAQQSPERGFRFLKDPLFFTNSVFVKSPERVAAIAFVMGLCLLVYNLGKRALRHALVEADQTIPNQLGQATQRPTLRWVFQCFQDVHLLLVTGVKQIANLTEERRWILRFFSRACRQYYLLI